MLWRRHTLKSLHEEIRDKITHTKTGPDGNGSEDKKERQAVTRVVSGDLVTAKPEAAPKATPRKGECQDPNGKGKESGDWV